MFQEYSDSSSDDDEVECVAPVPRVYVPPPMQPFDKHQGFFLANLAKMLDEAHVLRIEFAIRWHESIPNALQVSWTSFVDAYDHLMPVLTAYKMIRRANNVASARATWNRKLREWAFIMTPANREVWTVYKYPTSDFRPGCEYAALPLSRRQGRS